MSGTELAWLIALGMILVTAAWLAVYGMKWIAMMEGKAPPSLPRAVAR